MGKFKTSDKEHWQCEKDGARAADQMHRPAYEGTSMETKPVTVDRKREQKLIEMMHREKLEKLNRKKEKDDLL